ncbi:CsgE family curli-type amyloid fiber assembly protein [Burkholderia cepacia]|uniref:CsgE family curli-type amyloid fiber assembly protein n=1 Tax=Burkholderia cepacia TaxID=292 RepID=UPI0009BD4A3B|nr:CsgE family curli-type amyloid fiber assembly protein [Burkholderia cepacia]
MGSSASRRFAWGAVTCLSLFATARAQAQDTVDAPPSAAANGGHPIAPPSTLLNAERALEAPKRAPGAGPATAKPAAGARNALPEDQLGGTVTTDAVTLAGRDFYTYFSQTWSEIPLSERYLVAIHERPSGRYGSLIWVEFQQKRVFQTFLPIARANVKAVAESAASISFQTVIQDDLSNLLFPDSDLAKDEI